MAFKQSIKGDKNEQVESLSHNRITIEAGNSAYLLTIFLCILVVGAIAFMVVFHLALLEAFIVVTFAGFFLCLWIVALGFTIRHSVTTATVVSLNKAQRESAKIRVIAQTEQWLLWADDAGKPHFEATVHIDEHRQFLPAPTKPPDAMEAVLTFWDSGMSARAIERHLKASGIEGVSYRQICKILDMHRKGWNAKVTVDSDLVEDSE